MPVQLSRVLRFARFPIAIGLIGVGLCALLSCTSNPAPTPREIAAAVPANVGFSDRSSWLPWEVARQKHLFERHRANVDLKWFDRYAESVSALESGLLDANNQRLTDTIRAIALGEEWAIVLVTDLADGNLPNFGHLAVTRQQIEDRPEIVQGLVNAWFDSLDYIRSQPDKADRIAAKFAQKRANFTATPTTTPFGLEENLKVLTPGNDITHLSYAAEAIAGVLLENGSISVRPDLSQLLDDRFVKAYKLGMGNFITSPPNPHRKFIGPRYFAK
ncbi:MAG: hypothetical protein D6728_20960 [Cyanobacteria bacterium J055]|nr:MAG: hypothetical protein D6728_20960 [Cyanobacteria bacterium J055]